MGASLSILLAVVTQAGAPVAPSCSPPCAADQYCATDGRCYVAAPPPPPAQQPPPGYYAPAQQQQPGYDAPAQPGYYAPAQPQQPPPGYYAPAPQPPPAGYAQRPGFPPPAVYQPPPVVRPGPRYKEGPRFGLFLGGIALPDDADTTAAAGGVILTFGAQDYGFESRLYGVLYTVETSDTKTTGSALLWHGTRWWGAYGFGFGSGIGYADFTAHSTYGWSDSSGQLLAYVAPVMLRFGRAPTFELGVNAGATLFFAHDVRPYGYFYGGILF